LALDNIFIIFIYVFMIVQLFSMIRIDFAISILLNAGFLI